MPPGILAAALADSPLFVAYVDRSGRIAAVNENFLLLCGRDSWDPETRVETVFYPAPGLADAEDRLLDLFARRQRHSLRLRREFAGGGEELAVLVLDTGAGWLLSGSLAMPGEHQAIERITRLNNDLANAFRELRRRNLELQAAHEQIKKLQSLLPICFHCKKVRNDSGYWQELEHYIQDNFAAEFSHGICEECLRLKYPEYADKILAPNNTDAARPAVKSETAGSKDCQAGAHKG